MHQKLQCLQLALVKTKGTILHNVWPHVTQPMLQKLNKLSYEVLPHPPYSPDLSPTDYHFFKHLDNFLQGKCFHTQQEAENAFQELIKPRSTDFYTTVINLFLVGKNVLIIMAPILINKNVLANYNDLKFMVWNYNYICSNLIHYT